MNDLSGKPACTDAPPLEQARQAEGTALLVHLLKALKAYRLYQPGHRTLVGFAKEFHDLLLASLSQHGDVTFRVSQSRITWERLDVYQNSTKEESLSFRLFIQGVRELTFHPGIPLAEIDALLEVIHRAFDTKTSVEDLLSLLWEKDLRYVDVIVLDDFFEEGEQREFDEFTGQLEPNNTSASSMRETVGPLLDRLLDEHHHSGDGEDFDPDIFRLKDDEVVELKRWVGEEKDRDVYDDLPLVLREALQPNAGQDDAVQLTALIQASFEVLTEQGRASELVRLLTALGDVARSSRDPVIRDAVRTALSSIEPRRVLEALSRRFTTLTEQDREGLAELLASLPGSMIPELVKLLAEPGLDAIASSLLERLAIRHLDRLLPCLNDSPRTVLVPLIRVLAATGSPAVLAPIGKHITHADATVRREAIRSVGALGTKRAWSFLADLIGNDDESTRLAALRALEGVPPECFGADLMEIVRRRDFRQRSFFEKREVLLALARVDGEQVEKVLIALLARKSFFGREAQDEVRACAATALGRRGGTTARRALERFAGDRSSRVDTAIAQALAD